ncbi:unnamed protein product [Acanthoscelides obtectus]|uniref:Malate dehydrogenase, mitochondrial n=1 Tax=Acanthoscelides obtectus TaxID=200917 RepID=A0A9P0KRS8_ACAOB|nr:unnamed protein product [Acanthoscelides obtectus]CAK1622086.1 Malate dehydrogenase, mitochondrial [Acanthoscelides obtectus]
MRLRPFKGKVGQPLCLMLKQSSLIEELCVHDIVPTGGFASELNYVDTNCKVTAFTGNDNLANALQDSKIVVLLASAPDSNMMSVEKMWYQNSQIVLEIMNTYAKISPKPFLAVGTDPINSIIPMCAEMLKKAGGYNPNTLFGITTIDSVRANTFVAQCQGVEPECVMVPVIGGHSEETMVPVLSQAKPCADFCKNELENLMLNIQKAEDTIVKLKPHKVAPLSTAFATARFVISLVKGIKGYPDVVECAFVPSKTHVQLKYLATPVQLGPNGIARNLGIPPLSEFESRMLDNAIPSLIADIKRGEKFVGVIDPPTL